MTNAGFDTGWILLADKDPYAALGVSLVAEEKRILKRYRHIAKLLHPDAQVGKSELARQFASQVFARIINPAYQRLKQENTRKEALATMRFKVRRMTKAGKLTPSFESAQQLLRIPEPEVDVFYENTLTQLSNSQFKTPEAFHQTLYQISQLNLIFLRRKMGDAIIREKRVGLVAANTKIKPQEAETAAPTPPEPPVINYAERYGVRALTYLKQQNYVSARQELQEALKIEPNNIEYHSMIGQAYLMEKKFGMAKAHLKRAIQLRPGHPIAVKYMARLEQLQSASLTKQSATNRAPKVPQKVPAKTPPKPSSRSSAPKSQQPKQGWLSRLLASIRG